MSGGSPPLELRVYSMVTSRPACLPSLSRLPRCCLLTFYSLEFLAKGIICLHGGNWRGRGRGKGDGGGGLHIPPKHDRQLNLAPLCTSQGGVCCVVLCCVVVFGGYEDSKTSTRNELLTFSSLTSLNTHAS